MERVGIVMTIEQDWERLKKIFLKVKGQSAYPDMFIYAHIQDLRKVDRGVDFVIRRLMSDPEYSSRIGLHSGPRSPRYPLRVIHYRLFTGIMEYRYFLVEIPELMGKGVNDNV